MDERSRRRLLIHLVVIFGVLGFLSIGIAQQVITTTTTTVITLPATTKVITVTKPGTTAVTEIVHGGYRVVYIEMRPNQECVIVVEGEPRSVMTIPGASYPGTTVVYTIPKTVYETTITRVEGGTTRTTTGFEFVTVSVVTKLGPVTMTMTVPAPIYGEIKEYCKVITVTVINRFEAPEPMTIRVAIPGFTFKGTVVTMPTLFITGSVTATRTTVIPGTTYTTTIQKTGTTVLTTMTVPGTTVVKTVTLPPKTITKTITYKTTISKPPTKTETATKPPKPKPTKTITSETTTTEKAAAGIPMTLLIIIAAAVAIVIVIAVVLLTRRPRTARV